MMYQVNKTNDGFMVVDQSTGDFVYDEDGNNLFDLESEAIKLLVIARMREAIDNMFEAVEEGDAESIAHLAIRYKQLFGTKGEADASN
jgi:hypothetical protein